MVHSESYRRLSETSKEWLRHTRIFIPQAESIDFQRKPDFESLSQELRKPGVTRKLLWEENVQDTLAANQIPLQDSQFYVPFNRHIETSKATMHFTHQPGEKLETDWSKCKALHLLQSNLHIYPGFRLIGSVS